MKPTNNLKHIWEWFFLPLLQYKPENESVDHWLENLWGVQHRDIIKYRARQKFELPGLFCEAPLLRVQGIGKRKVIKGQHLWMRNEGPDEIHIEKGKWGQESVFVLTNSEWNSIAANLEEIN